MQHHRSHRNEDFIMSARSCVIERPLVIAIGNQGTKFFAFLALDRRKDREKIRAQRLGDKSGARRVFKRSVPLRGHRARGPRHGRNAHRIWKLAEPVSSIGTLPVSWHRACVCSL